MMIKKSSLLLTIALASGVVFSAGLTGCHSTPTSRSTGETVTDAGITASVKSRLAQAEGLGDALKINVDTYRGAVSLSGFLETQEEIDKAIAVARSTDGVKQVKSALAIKRKS